MKNYYSSETIDNIKKDNARYIIISVTIFAIFVTSYVLSLVYVNDKNLIILQVSISILFALFLCFGFYVVVNVFIKNKRRINHINSILEPFECVQINGVIKEVNKGLTIDKDIDVNEVILISEGKEFTYLVNKEYLDTFVVGSSITGSRVGNYLINLEMTANE